MNCMTNELIQHFEENLINNEKSSSTIEKYIRDIKAFYFWLGDIELTKSAVLKYKEHIIKIYAVASVNSMLSSLNSFFVFNEWYHLKVKSLKVQKLLFVNREKELTKHEYERLLNAAQKRKNQKLYYLMQTICSTGICVSELKFITVEAVKKSRCSLIAKGREG